MTARELLGVFVRLAGLTSILMSVFDFYHVVVKTLGVEISSNYTVSETARGVVLYLVLGVALIMGANQIVRFAYWRETR